MPTSVFRKLSLCLLVLLLTGVAVSAAEPGSPYAIHSHISRGDEHPFLDREVELMNEAGIEWVRTDFSWNHVQPQPDARHYSNIDDVVEAAEAADINVLALLHGTPGWAEPTIEHLDQWLAFVRETVTRYKGRVPAWQVWNEPNLEHFWKDPDPLHYAQLLRATHEVIKEVDPEALVVWGATSQFDTNFMAAALSASEGRFDVMAVHPYGYDDPQGPEAYVSQTLDEMRALLGRHGMADKPIWFTEWGGPAHTGQHGMSDRQQGQYIARAYILALQNGLQRGFWYEFQERSEGDEVNEDAFGILEYSLEPKPAYHAYTTLIDARPAGSRSLGPVESDGFIHHTGWVRPDGERVHALWDVYGRWASPRPVPVRLEGELRSAHDYLGRPVKVAVDTDGRATLPLEWGSPVYLFGPESVTLE